MVNESSKAHRLPLNMHGSQIITVHETVGVVLLGLLALGLLIALERAHERERKLMAELLELHRTDAE